MNSDYEDKFRSEIIPKMEARLHELTYRLAFIIHSDDTYVISPYKQIRKPDTLKNRETCLTLEMTLDTFLRLATNEIDVIAGINHGWITPWPKDRQDMVALYHSLIQYFR